MAKRAVFGKLAFDSLEGRLVLNGAMGTVVALGDSTTDEYQFAPPIRTHARNWVEILAFTRKANFGWCLAMARSFCYIIHRGSNRLKS